MLDTFLKSGFVCKKCLTKLLNHLLFKYFCIKINECGRVVHYMFEFEFDGDSSNLLASLQGQ